MTEASLEDKEFCTFFLDAFLFGVPVRTVQEVIKKQPMTRVPLAPPVIQGLINLRGQIVSAFDLRRRLGFSERRADQAPENVVVHLEDGIVSLLVDKIGEVMRVHASAFERPPETITGVAREFITGVYKLADRLLLILDIEKAVNVVAAGGRAH